MTIYRSESLTHRTQETGHERLSPLAEVDPDLLTWLRPLVRRSLSESVEAGDLERCIAWAWLTDGAADA